MSVFAWVRAARLPSQSYIALPLLLGQVLAWRATGQWSWWVFALVQAFGVFDQFYIVFANDYADRHDDPDNDTATIFSGGSRVLVEGSLTPSALLRAAIVMALAALGTGAALAVGWGRIWIPAIQAFGLALLWAYSYGPRLSYRGGGELLQMAGVAVVLPVVGWLAQAGTLGGFPLELLAFLLPLNLATAVCTALPDEPSDRRADKRTLAVLLGGRRARGLVMALNLTGLIGFAAVALPALRPWLDGAGTGALLAVPAASILAQAVFYARAEPGSRAILGFVFFGLLCNLSLAAGILIAAVL
jgi:1,4-dihydroxy-2-naphthoate octaprenyltransferase